MQRGKGGERAALRGLCVAPGRTLGAAVRALRPLLTLEDSIACSENRWVGVSVWDGERKVTSGARRARDQASGNDRYATLTRP